MSSINASAYYQLPNSLTGQSNQSQTSKRTSLADLLNAVNPSSAAKTNNQGNQSYLLNLSDAAQSYLSSLNGTGNTQSSSSSGSDTFLLSPKQRDALNEIIAKYKDQPITQDTYNQLQQDLDAAGIGPKQLAVRDQLRDLNPTRFFLDSLNGTDTSNGQKQQFGELTDQQKTQANNYLESILKQLQTISTVSDGESA
ncbi:MAG: hypothetical protein ACKVOE_02085 [Rickettsiales bacterium]